MSGEWASRQPVSRECASKEVKEYTMGNQCDVLAVAVAAEVEGAERTDVAHALAVHREVAHELDVAAQVEFESKF